MRPSSGVRFTKGRLIYARLLTPWARDFRASYGKIPPAMLTKTDNELLVRVGPKTPMGELFRRFWTPVMLATEIGGPDSPLVRVRILGEDLVAFRDSHGKLGLLDAYCPHR